MTVHEFEKRPRVVDVPEPEVFRCPRCGEPVDAYATRCRACGVNFAAPAYAVAKRGYTPASQRSRFLKWILFLGALLAGAVIAAMYLGRG
jgi:hypothetical protein